MSQSGPISAPREQSLHALGGDALTPDGDLACLIDGLLDGFYTLDGEWRIVHFNRAAEEHFGVARNEVIGRSIWHLFPSKIGSEFDLRFRRVLETGRTETFEAASESRIDTFVLMRAMPFGKGLSVTFRNITAVRSNEQALRESQARLEIATAAANIGVWDWNLVTNEMVYSDRAKALYGFSPDQPVTYEMVRDATHPEDYPRTSALARRATDATLREKVPYEYRIIAPDGMVRWLLAHGEAVFAKIGGIERAVRYVGTIQDITARKQAEEKLRASESRLGLAIEAGQMAVWEYDVASNTIQGSPRLNQLLGFAADDNPSLAEMQGRYYPGEQERVQQIGADALARGERFFDAEYRYCWPDGAIRWLMLRAEIVLDPAGAPQAVIGVVLDITDRKKTEERQSLLIQELNHRVKNTLAIVQSIAAQTFRKVSADSRSHVRTFEERLFAVARAHDVLTRERWDGAELREIIEEVLAPHAQQSGNRFRMSGQRLRVSPLVALRIAMSVHELATNATKYGSLSMTGGHVLIDWSVAEEPAVLTLNWVERGGPPVSPPAQTGFGTRLIERMSATDIDGSGTMIYEPTGLKCIIKLALIGPQEAADAVTSG